MYIKSHILITIHNQNGEHNGDERDKQ